jgi:hypothetical protein
MADEAWTDAYALNGNPNSMGVSSTDSGTPSVYETNYGSLGFHGDPNDYNQSGGQNDLFLKNLGWTGGDPYHYAMVQGNDSGTVQPGDESGYTPEFQQFLDGLKAKGITFKTRPDGQDSGLLQAFGPDGQPIGTPLRSKMSSDSQFGFMAALMIGGFAAASVALAGGAAAGAAGGAGAAAPGSGMSMAGAAAGAGVPAAGTAAGAGTAAATGASAATAAGASGAGTGLFGTGYSLSQIASAASTAFSLAQKAGLTGDKSGAGYLESLGAAALNLYSAGKAGEAQDASIDIQTASADQQSKIAQEQWDYHKNTYLPEATKLAKESSDLTGKIAKEQNELATFNAEVERQAVAQGMKSYAYQDQYMRMTDKYVNGEMANTMADESHADTMQAAGMARQASQTAMQRRGINAGSGAGMAMMADQDLATAAADAGGQTAARRYARDKAEAMVATVANAGTATIGQGLQAGSLATGANANAVGASASGSNVWNSVNNSNAYGAGAAGSNASGAGQTGYRIGNTYGGSLVADAGAGTLTGLAKTGGGLVDAMGNLTKGMTWNGGSTPTPAQLGSADSNGSWDRIEP